MPRDRDRYAFSLDKRTVWGGLLGFGAAVVASPLWLSAAGVTLTTFVDGQVNGLSGGNARDRVLERHPGKPDRGCLDIGRVGGQWDQYRQPGGGDQSARIDMVIPAAS